MHANGTRQIVWCHSWCNQLQSRMSFVILSSTHQNNCTSLDLSETCLYTAFIIWTSSNSSLHTSDLWERKDDMQFIMHLIYLLLRNQVYNKLRSWVIYDNFQRRTVCEIRHFWTERAEDFEVRWSHAWWF